MGRDGLARASRAASRGVAPRGRRHRRCRLYRTLRRTSPRGKRHIGRCARRGRTGRRGIRAQRRTGQSGVETGPRGDSRNLWSRRGRACDRVRRRHRGRRLFSRREAWNCLRCDARGVDSAGPFERGARDREAPRRAVAAAGGAARGPRSERDSGASRHRWLSRGRPRSPRWRDPALELRARPRSGGARERRCDLRRNEGRLDRSPKRRFPYRDGPRAFDEATRVLLATNGYTDALWPKLRETLIAANSFRSRRRRCRKSSGEACYPAVT